MRYLYLSLLTFLYIACQNPKKNQMDTNTVPTDVHSYSKPKQAFVEHLNLELKIDFESKKLEGTALYDIHTEDGVEEIIFDTYDLNIIKVEVGDELDADFDVGPKDEILGSPLTVSLPVNAKKVKIYYHTSPTAKALQWLSPDQTSQKEAPFLFTQSQAILARSWIPCQDSPGIRFTYEASIKVPEGFMALMSAENPKEINPLGQYNFNMPQPIPSYLMALTVGIVEFKEIGPRTGVYAEPNMLEKSHFEFSDMEAMLISAEDIYGSYAWGRYDVIVLPPSFPFGGMENPRLTFATPTIIAGDKSLTSLIAHELAHSWSGNLVTNATWNDFWLNEGFTVYFEQRIMEAVYGRDYSEMLALLSYQGLLEEMEELNAKNPDDTKLKLNLESRDPDDGMSAIAYDKGYLFLRKIEESIGREKFDTFLKNYFKENAFKVMDTETFLGLLREALTEEQKSEIAIDDWVYQSGLPKNHPIIKSEKFNLVDTASAKWIETDDIEMLKTDEWSTHEWIHFINNLPEEIDTNLLVSLDEQFGLTNSGNCEILAAWFQVTIRREYRHSDVAIKEFLIHVGRRKFLTPTYKALIERDSTKEMARDIYRLARKNYHSVSKGTMDELLNWKS